ncbi:DUF3850 domain-containing protein [Serratia bockelmannii]|uniref:DUF3850 domain-containing protein n=1 Tax=Serratia bockelmannii TaxID=2703793 RepID=UPI003314BB24
MKKHNLKIEPESFAAVVSGARKAEFCLNDRDFSVGDLICLQEYGPHPEFDHLVGFTGESVWVRVTHITTLGKWAPDFVMLSIERGPFKL